MTSRPGGEEPVGPGDPGRPVIGLAGPRRAVPQPDGGRPALIALLRDESERQGPLTFARFMQRALYEPGLGYYSVSTDRPTRAGDFVTSPELHPIFGRALARQLHEMWQRLGEPERFTLREYGAGSGRLAVDLLDGLAEMASPLAGRLRYQPIEVAGRLDAVVAALEGAGHGDAVELGRADGPAAPMIGCVLANEFIDALPVHRVVRRGDELRELFVGWDSGGFVEIEGAPSTPELGRWFHDRALALPEGQVAEVNLAMIDWVAEVARSLERGYVLVLDYGAEPAELYGPTRRTGTLRAFRGQHVSSDILAGVGEQDLTAHVDFDALARAASAAGLVVLGAVSQAELLMGCGLEEIFATAQARLPDEWRPRLELQAAVRRLLDPRHLGGYRVIVLGCDVPPEPPLRGLSFRLPQRA